MPPKDYTRYLQLKEEFLTLYDEAHCWFQPLQKFVLRHPEDIAYKEYMKWSHDHLEEWADLCKRFIMYKPSSGIFRHLITFTRNPNSNYSIEQFKKSCEQQIARNLFACVKYTSEHHDTNIHYHAWVTTKYSITKKRFEAHSKKHGNVDVRKPGKDNGIDSYFTKENTILYLVDQKEATAQEYENKNLAPY